MAEKIHRGKIKTPPDPLVVKYLIAPGIKSDIKYRYQAFLDCNKAHVLMLAKQKIVTKEVAAAILRCNNELAAMGDGPTFEVDPGREDFYFNIEAYLIEHVGIEIGGQQHTARSRNDLYATCARLGVRKAYFEICHIYNRMRQAILDVAAKNTDAVFAGYTHMQPSEPITFAHYCSAILNAMQRDYRRIAHCYEALNICPLGGGSMGSTTWDIDRNYTAKLLGFDAPVDNSIDCVASRDFTTDILAVLSLSANTLSRFCQDLYVWATPDYGYILRGFFLSISTRFSNIIYCLHNHAASPQNFVTNNFTIMRGGLQDLRRCICLTLGLFLPFRERRPPAGKLVRIQL